MKNFSKVLSIILVIAMFASAAMGCGSTGNGTGNAQNQTSAGSAEADNGEKDASADSGTDAGDAQAAGTPEQNTGNEAEVPEQGAQEEKPAYEIVRNAFTPAPFEAKTYDEEYSYDAAETDLTLKFDKDGTFKFLEENTLYSKDLTLQIKAPDGATVRYTLDGTEPDENSDVYKQKLKFTAKEGSFPEAYIFRAAAYYKDGSRSKTAARTYLTGTELDGRFSTIIISVSGDPAELTESPNGIFTGFNYNERGRESEREVYIEAWKPNGKNLFSQYGGVRIYGGYSRQYSIKSMKLYARKSYDEKNSNFKLKTFGTPALYGSGETIEKYDRLVLRNFGNDFQFAYIRDELSQSLCKAAGFECYEAVLPVACYLNGKYYSFYWMHENYSDKYFKEKYGKADGEFVVLEGSDQHKSSEDDPEVQKLVEEFNDFYKEISRSDLTDEANYASLREFMDVENYLDYFAWNIAINNWDWPNNNLKCFKYVPKAGEASRDGVYDGRWRFLVHDMDFTYELYDSDTTQPSYNTLQVVLSAGHDRYSPLLNQLLKRDDCRNYFRQKTYEYLDGVLTPEYIKSVYEALHASREKELAYFYQHLRSIAESGDFSIWSSSEHYRNYEKQIIDFAKKRGEYVEKYMEELFASKYEK